LPTEGKKKEEKESPSRLTKKRKRLLPYSISTEGKGGFTTIAALDRKKEKKRRKFEVPAPTLGSKKKEK